jgi:hypothetical protein
MTVVYRDSAGACSLWPPANRPLWRPSRCSIASCLDVTYPNIVVAACRRKPSLAVWLEVS